MKRIAYRQNRPENDAAEMVHWILCTGRYCRETSLPGNVVQNILYIKHRTGKYRTGVVVKQCKTNIVQKYCQGNVVQEHVVQEDVVQGSVVLEMLYTKCCTGICCREDAVQGTICT